MAGTSPAMTRLRSSVRKARGALVDIGADCFGLVRTSDQLLLFERLGEQRGTGIDGQLVQHPLGGADRVGAFAGDLKRDLQGRPTRIVANPGRKAIVRPFWGRENPPRKGRSAKDVVT